jgi:hypothetical protein
MEPDRKRPDTEDASTTIHYLAEYLNQLIMDNCKLKGELDNKEKQV